MKLIPLEVRHEKGNTLSILELNEEGSDMRPTPDGRFVYVIGETRSKDLPLLRAVQSKPSGAFLAKFVIPTNMEFP
jgi:hypothetical protein